MPDIIKIGITSNLSKRIKELDKTSVPLPFECYYAVKVDDAAAIEKNMHHGLDDCRVRQNREFFYASPETAKSLLQIAEIMGGKDVTPTEDIFENPQDKQALNNAKQKRSRFNFQILNMTAGTILQFKKDNAITCEVVNDTKVKFRDEVTSLSKSANTVIEEMGYDWGGKIHGPAFWCYRGKSLADLRIENEGS